MDSFPEQTYPIPPVHASQYYAQVTAGKLKMKGLTTLICGLARDIEALLPQSIARLESLGQMFKDYQVYVFENDSADNTLPILRRWERSNSRVFVESATYGHPLFSQVVNADRRNKMATYRNMYMNHIDLSDTQYDIMTVLDMDMMGISRDGVAHSFSYEFDMMGSYGIWYRPVISRRGRRTHTQQVHFDADAYREFGHPHVHDYNYVHAMNFKRGHPPIKVCSCFGGLGFYNMEKVKGLRYAGGDCEHVPFHDQMQTEKIFMNPSQITLYRKH